MLRLLLGLGCSLPAGRLLLGQPVCDGGVACQVQAHLRLQGAKLCAICCVECPGGGCQLRGGDAGV